jgi:hypothetical protein
VTRFYLSLMAFFGAMLLMSPLLWKRSVSFQELKDANA